MRNLSISVLIALLIVILNACEKNPTETFKDDSITNIENTINLSRPYGIIKIYGTDNSTKTLFQSYDTTKEGSFVDIDASNGLLVINSGNNNSKLIIVLSQIKSFQIGPLWEGKLKTLDIYI